MSAEALGGLLRSFRLPTMAAIWEETVARAEREARRRTGGSAK